MTKQPRGFKRKELVAPTTNIILKKSMQAKGLNKIVEVKELPQSETPSAPLSPTKTLLFKSPKRVGMGVDYTS
jgi:hypothetical protein